MKFFLIIFLVPLSLFAQQSLTEFECTPKDKVGVTSGRLYLVCGLNSAHSDISDTTTKDNPKHMTAKQIIHSSTVSRYLAVVLTAKSMGKNIRVVKKVSDNVIQDISIIEE